jgi:exopolyphosphatase/guanosine-5'-triphosphate,3'-diphosphate pyrophosphatase
MLVASPYLQNTKSMQEGSLLAAVDLGSNSFRLEIGQLQGKQIVRRDYLKEPVRLGAGLNEARQLSRGAMQRGAECLARFAERLRGFPAGQIRAVATQTLREAVNRDEFLELARDALGYDVEVISGREEARLIYSGVSHLLADPNEQRLVIDIGGRSTEVIVGHGLKPLEAESFKLGSVSYSMRYFDAGRFPRAGFEQAIIAVAAEVEDSIETFQRYAWRMAYGSSGTAGALADILRSNRISDGTITLDGLLWLREQCERAGHIDKLRIEGLKEDRRPVLAGGLAVMLGMFEALGLQEMEAARGALRHGVMFDLLGRERIETDMRNGTVRRLQQRFASDQVHSQRVQDLALSLYRRLVPMSVEPLLVEAERELGWAALLHELGMCISHSDYHRHGAYLVEHADAPGFSESQQARLAALVLGHRGGLKKLEPWLADARFVEQLMALRLAVILVHARRKLPNGVFTLTRGEKTVHLALDPDWAASHPQTLYLLSEEAGAWKRAGVRVVLD